MKSHIKRAKRAFERRQYTDEDMLFVLKNGATAELKAATDSIAKFAAEVVQNTRNALELSKSTFEVAAKAEVAKSVLRYIERFANENAENTHAAKTARQQLEIMLQEFRAAAMRNLKLAHFTSSPTSNLMSARLGMQFAEWTERLENHIAYIGTKYKHYL